MHSFLFVVFFFKQKTAYDMRISDWSSDVCSSDLRLLHISTAKSDRPFVHVDCASLPAELIESELFGHEKGAFTNAQGSRCGLIEAAEDGTLFLDEIGELPLALQAKLLNVLERRMVRRLGDRKSVV